MQIEMGKEKWRNDTDRGNPQYSDNKQVSMSISPPLTDFGSNPAYAVTNRPLTAAAIIRL